MVPGQPQCDSDVKDISRSFGQCLTSVPPCIDASSFDNHFIILGMDVLNYTSMPVTVWVDGLVRWPDVQCAMQEP